MDYNNETFSTEERRELYDEFIKKVNSEYEALKSEVHDDVKIALNLYDGQEEGFGNFKAVTSFISTMLLPGKPPTTYDRRESLNLRCAMYECFKYSFEHDSEYYINNLNDHQIYNIKHLSHPLACLFELSNARNLNNDMKYTTGFNTPEGIADMLRMLSIEVDAVDKSAFVLAVESYQHTKYRNNHLAHVYDDIDMYDKQEDIIEYEKVADSIAYAVSKIGQTCKDLYDYYLSDGIFIIKGYVDGSKD